MPQIRGLILFFSLFFITACSGINATRFLESKQLSALDKDRYYHCYGGGCLHKTLIKPHQDDWAAVESFFAKPLPSAEAEREKIQFAISALEIISGTIAGTDRDMGGTFESYGSNGPAQLDCIDESLNTTIYLESLQRRGLLKFHDVMPPAARVPLINPVTWPHQTAVIRDKKTSAIWVVDSWFHDNGHKPEIIEIDRWKSGWKPPE